MESCQKPTCYPVTTSLTMAFAGPITSNVPTTTTHGPLVKDIQKIIRSLHIKYKDIQLAEDIQSQGKSLNQVQQELLCSKLRVLSDLECLEKTLNMCSKDKTITMMNEGESKVSRDNQRYLCVSDGCMIMCLDLEMYEKIKVFSDHTQPLPKISTIKFSENPTSMGLFKLGSYAYLVGGNCFRSDPIFSASSNAECKGELRCKTYELSLKDKNLCYCECKSIGELISLKYRPVVEKIENRIHVIESAPEVLHPVTVPSHEVLNVKQDGWVWEELSSSSKCVFCSPFLDKPVVRHTNHLVISDRIFLGGFRSDQYKVFDSEKNQWEVWRHRNYPKLHKISHVGQLLSFGYGRCAGRWCQNDGDPELYVVIALAADKTMEAAAYLVKPTGQVLCYQPLPLFFVGFPRFFRGSKGTLINVEEGGGKTKTMCAVVDGQFCEFRLCSGEPQERFLHVSTFTVEECHDAHTLVSALCATTTTTESNAYQVTNSPLPDAVQKDFVKVIVKDWYAFSLTQDDMSDTAPCVTACFL